MQYRSCMDASRAACGTSSGRTGPKIRCPSRTSPTASTRPIGWRAGCAYLLDRHLGPDWQDRLDEPSPVVGAWMPFRTSSSGRFALHLKRKLAFYMRERVRGRWIGGRISPRAGRVVRCAHQSLRAHDRLCSPLCHLQARRPDLLGHANGCWRSSIAPIGRFRSSSPARRILPTRPASCCCRMSIVM